MNLMSAVTFAKAGLADTARVLHVTDRKAKAARLERFESRRRYLTGGREDLVRPGPGKCAAMV